MLERRASCRPLHTKMSVIFVQGHEGRGGQYYQQARHSRAQPTLSGKGRIFVQDTATRPPLSFNFLKITYMYDIFLANFVKLAFNQT